MKRVVTASNIRKNEYDPESLKKAVYALFDTAFASSAAREKLGTNDITYTITSIKVNKTARPLQYWLNVRFIAESPDFEYTSESYSNVVISDVPTGRQANEDEFINQKNVDSIVDELRGDITNSQIEDVIQSNIENFKSAIDEINLEYPEIELEYEGEFIKDNELTFLQVRLLRLGEHEVHNSGAYRFGYVGDQRAQISGGFQIQKSNKTPFHTQILSVEDYVESLRSYVDSCLKYLEVFDKCCKVLDTFKGSLSSAISAVASELSVDSEDFEAKVSADYKGTPKVIVRFLGTKYEVTDSNGNQILSPSDIVKKAINSLRYPEKEAKNPAQPSSRRSSSSKELL